MGKAWKIQLEEEFRYGNDAGDFYYQHSDLGLSYSGFAKWVDVGVNYRGIFEEKKNDWQYENRPHLNLTVKTDWKGFNLSNRGRMEFRIRQRVEDKPRYRNKATIKMPVKWSKIKIQPYVGDEFFLDFESTEMTRNRVYLGFEGRPSEDLKIELYYMLESTKSSHNDWNEINVVGTSLKLSF